LHGSGDDEEETQLVLVGRVTAFEGNEHVSELRSDLCGRPRCPVGIRGGSQELARSTKGVCQLVHL
jgi:hypothetical protein